MNKLQRKSLFTNLNNFTRELSDEKLIELTNFLVYDCHTEEAPKHIADFIDDFFGAKDWMDNLSDEIKKPEFFNKATSTVKELIRLVRIDLLETSFNRFHNLVKKSTKVKVVKEVKPKLTNQEKTELKEILYEHKLMLEYQLEDEKFIQECDNTDEGNLVDIKKRQVELLKKTRKINFI